jgi:multisubunit Na+/H+ antiporter MnhF subunit
MRKQAVLAVCLLLSFVGSVFAEGESPADRFLGSPLLPFVVILILVLLAFVYRKIRR